MDSLMNTPDVTRGITWVLCDDLSGPIKNPPKKRPGVQRSKKRFKGTRKYHCLRCEYVLIDGQMYIAKEEFVCELLPGRNGSSAG